MDVRIIDMNSDCIEHVLKLLDFEDLLNVAESNKFLSSKACQVMSHRFHQCALALIFDSSKFGFQHHNLDYQFDEGEIRVWKFRTGVKILKHFGHLCTRVVIGYKYMSSKEKRIIEYYLSKCCSNELSSLTDLTLEDCPEDALEYSIGKPLKSIRNVIITGDSALTFDSINKAIPNMEFLELTWIQVTDTKSIERKFPSLKQLNVEIYDRTDGFTAINIQKMIKMNPQLTRMSVRAHEHPDLDIDALTELFENNFNAPGKEAVLILPTTTISISNPVQ